MRLKLNLIGVDAELTDEVDSEVPVLRRHATPDAFHDYHAGDIVNALTQLTAKEAVSKWANSFSSFLTSEDADLVRRFLDS